jgi:ribonuclease Z
VDGKVVTLPDGREVTPDQVLGEEKRGTKLVHVGDTGTVDDLYEVVRDADALIIEATYLESEQELAQRFGHLTAFQAATLARDAGVEHLILTHISRRYHEQELLEEARAVFPRVEVARDFDRFRVKRGELKKV